MPMIKVEMLSGRSAEQKRRLAKALTETFVEICGGEPKAVQIIFADVERSDWAVGGTLCSEMVPAPTSQPMRAG